MLELGCGTGLFLSQLSTVEWVMGIDRDPACAASAVRRVASRPNIQIECLDALDPAVVGLSLHAFDSAVFMASLEEMEDDALAVRNAASVLKPGGRVIVMAAAMPSLRGALDDSFGSRRYRKGEIEALFAGAGLSTISLRHVNLLGAFGWWWDSKVRRRRSVPAQAYRARDRLVPLARFLDAVTGPPVGRSLFAVGRKP